MSESQRVRESEGQGDGAVAEMVRVKAVLAPMSGITDMPFRMMARKHGCAFAFTEMIDVNGLVYKNRKSFKLLDRFPGDSPLGVQVVGQDEDRLAYAAGICEERGFKLLDLNAGCPARKVVKGGKGAALLKDPRKLSRIVRRLVKELTIPVTVKIRSGWDKDSENYLEVAKAAECEGAAAICVHSRTKEQMYRGKADHGVTRAIKEAVNIPVFASGSMLSPSAILDALNTTGCDGVFVARGALGRPWIFRDIQDMMSAAPVSVAPTFEEIKDMITEHFSLCLRYYGDIIAFRRMYKHICWYLKSYKGLNEVMREYQLVRDSRFFGDFMERLGRGEGKRLCLGG